MAEQLWYTWAKRGPTGRSGFQVVAASPGLPGLSSTVAQEAEQLCRSPGEADAQASPSDVSFGWVNSGRWRLVFNRVPAGDSSGRPGGFCAHIVVGEIAELPTHLIAQWFGSPMWWTRDEEGLDGRRTGVLDVVVPATVSPGPVAAPDQVQLAAFLEALLGREGRRLLIPAEPAQVAALAAGAERAVRGILAGASLSTCESERYAGSFDLAGIGVGGRAPYGSLRWDEELGADQAAGRVAQAIVTGKLAEQLCALAGRLSTVGEGVDARRFVRVADTLLALESGQISAFGAIPADLIGPKALAVLLDRDDGLRLAARALADHNDPAWDAVGRSARNLSSGQLARLGSALGELIAGSGRISSLGSYLARAERVVVQLAEAAAATILAACKLRPDLLRDVDQDGRLWLLRYLHHSSRDSQLAIDLIQSCGSADWSIVSVRDLPDDWRALAAVNFLASGRSTAYLAGQLAIDAGLAMALVRRLPSQGPLLILADSCALVDAVAITLNACPALSDQDGLLMVRSVTERLPPEEKVGLVSRYVDQRSATWASHAPAELHRLVSITIAEAVLARANKYYQDVTLTESERRLLATAGGSLRYPWLNIDKHEYKARTPVDILRAVRPQFADADLVVRQAAERVALRCAVAACTTAEHVAELVIDLSHGAEPNEENCCVALAANAYRVLSMSTAPAAAVLVYVADRIDAGRLPVSGKAMTDPALAKMLTVLVAKLPDPVTDQIGEWFKGGSKQVRQWWAVLAQHGPFATIQVNLPRLPRHRP